MFFDHGGAVKRDDRNAFGGLDKQCLGMPTDALVTGRGWSVETQPASTTHGNKKPRRSGVR
jgi:hypothetical protein